MDRERTALIVEGKVHVAFPFDASLVSAVREITGRKWNPTHKVWEVPATPWHYGKIVEVLEPLGFYIDPEILKGGDQKAPPPKHKYPKGLYPFQRAGVDFLYNVGGRAIIADEMGLGKAQPLDAKILTPQGWRKMGDIKVDDWVVSPKSGYARVLRVFDRGMLDVYRVGFSDGSYTECSLDHLWEVQTPLRKWRRAKSLILSLGEIINRGLTHSNGNNKFYIPLTKPVDLLPSIYPVNPYVLGVLLGDGGLTHSIILSSADDELLINVSGRLPDDVSLKYVGRYDYRITGNGKDGNSLLLAVKSLGLFGKRSEHKFIPDIYIHGPVSVRLDILQGLLDTDGWVDIGKRGNHIGFSSSSKELSYGVVQLVQSLGGTARVSIKHTPKLDAYVVSISMPAGIIPFKLSRKANLCPKREKYAPSRAITSVSYIGIKPVRCIKIDAEDGLYVTDDYIVTHNTITSLAYIKLFAGRKVLVVCPASVVYKWEAEVNKWLPDWTTQVVTSGKDVIITSNDVIIMSYAMMVAHYEKLNETPFDVMVCDECHYTKGRKTARGRVARALVKAGIPKVLLLSGTPFLNRPDELFPLLNMLDPVGFGNFFVYAKRYMGAEYINGMWFFPPGLVTNRDELAGRLTRMMIRRTKGDVAIDLPDLQRAMVPVEIANRAAYRKALKDIREWLESKDREVVNPAHALTRLNVLRQIVGEGKVPAAVELAENILQDGKKVVLFAHHKAIVEALKEKLKDYGVLQITGEISQKERSSNVNEFLSLDSSSRVMIISTAGAEGIDLFSASDIIFVERQWTPAMEEQAEARLHRMGQKNPVTAWYLVAKGTVDEKLAKIVAQKRETIGQIISQDEVLTTIMSDILEA